MCIYIEIYYLLYPAQTALFRKHRQCLFPVTLPCFFQALYLATLGGAGALGLAEHLGSFEEQKRFDAVLLRRDHNEGKPPEKWTAESKEDLLLKIITLGDDRNSFFFYIMREGFSRFLMIFLCFPFGFFLMSFFFLNLFRMMVRKNHRFFRGVPPRHWDTGAPTRKCEGSLCRWSFRVSLLSSL